MRVKDESKTRTYFIIALCALLFLSGCITPGAFIRNEESYSQNIPIKTKPTFLIFGEELLLNEYSLRYKGNIPNGTSYTIGTAGTAAIAYGRNILGRRYNLYKNGLQLYTVDITASDRKLHIGDITVTFDIEMAIIIHNNDTIKEVYKVNFDKKTPYVQFKDSNLGEINFDFYKSTNKNNPKEVYEIFAGFQINANNEEYGIISIYYPALYKKTDTAVSDKMALYILSAYAHYYHYGRENITSF